jgi:hypothetical protein
MGRKVAYLGLILVIIAQLVAAPAPAPTVCATIDLVKPPQGKTMEAYRHECIDALRSKPIITHMLDKSVGGGWLGVSTDQKGTRVQFFIEKIGKLQIVKEQNDAAAWLVENLKIEPIGKTAIRVRMTAGSTKDQVAIINATLAAFLDKGPPIEGDRLFAELRNSQRLRATFTDAIASKEKTIAEMKQRGMPKNKEEAKARVDRIAQDERNLAGLKVHVKGIDSDLEELQAALDNTAPPPLVHPAKDPDARSRAKVSDAPPELIIEDRLKGEEKRKEGPTKQTGGKEK